MGSRGGYLQHWDVENHQFHDGGMNTVVQVWVGGLHTCIHDVTVELLAFLEASEVTHEEDEDQGWWYIDIVP